MLDPSGGLDMTADVLIADGMVAELRPSICGIEDAMEIDAAGKWLIPGLIDMHVHLREPGGEESETLETGLRAAVAGGVTAVGVMPNTEPPMDDPRSVSALVERAASLGLARAVPIPCVTAGRKGKRLADLRGLAEAGATAFSDDGSPVRDSSLLLRALTAVRDFEGVVIEHPEDESLSGGHLNLGAVSRRMNVDGIPPLAETSDVARCMEIASSCRGRLHLTHLSLPRSVELARAGCFSAAEVTVDVTPHHLALDESAVEEHGAMAKMNPPLRAESDRRGLAEMVSRGMVDAVASDHAPHSKASKEGGIEEAAFGIAGLETLLPVTLDVLGRHGMQPLDILRLLTCGPARVLGLAEPSVRPGMPAECVLFDPAAEYRPVEHGSFSRSSNTPFRTKTLRGRVEAVWIGELVYRGGEFARS